MALLGGGKPASGAVAFTLYYLHAFLVGLVSVLVSLSFRRMLCAFYFVAFTRLGCESAAQRLASEPPAGFPPPRRATGVLQLSDRSPCSMVLRAV